MNADERIALIRRKVEWADTQFSNLETIKNNFIESKPYAISSEPDPKPGHEGCDRFFMTRIDEIDPRIALIAGDIVHNLRSALDHLACSLVEVAGNPVSDQTMFPIFRGDKIDEPSFRRKVEGMRNSAKDRIKKTEPYKGGKGHDLWVLHKLDIADKHHALLVTLIRVGDVRIRARGGLYNFVFPRFAVPNYGDALEVGKPFFTCERDRHDETEITFDIAISEADVPPRPVSWAMKRLISTADNLVLSFKPELV